MTILFASAHRRLFLACAFCVLLGIAPLGFAQEKDNATAEDRSSSGTEEETRSAGESEAAEKTSQDDETSAKEQRRVKRITTKKDRSRTAGTTRKDSPLVKAAKSSSRARSDRSFTDADLDKSKGRLIIVEGTNVREPKVQTIEERAREAERERREQAQEDQRKTAQKQGKEFRIRTLQSKIQSLQNDLRRLENDFLVTEEDDRREAIQDEFKTKNEELAEAKKMLDELQGGGGGS